MLQGQGGRRCIFTATKLKRSLTDFNLLGNPSKVKYSIEIETQNRDTHSTNVARFFFLETNPTSSPHPAPFPKQRLSYHLLVKISAIPCVYFWVTQGFVCLMFAGLSLNSGHLPYNCIFLICIYIKVLCACVIRENNKYVLG